MFTLAFDNMWYILHTLPPVKITKITNNIFIGIYFLILLVKKKTWPRINSKLGSKIEKKQKIKLYIYFIYSFSLLVKSILRHYPFII